MTRRSGDVWKKRLSGSFHCGAAGPGLLPGSSLLGAETVRVAGQCDSLAFCGNKGKTFSDFARLSPSTKKSHFLQ